MAPHARRPDAAELGYRTWNSLRVRAGELPGEFTPQARGDVSGWLWEGALAALIREVVPGIADADLRRVREYLNASGMVVNVHGQQRGGGQPQWFIRSAWHEGRGGHVHVVTSSRASRPAAPAASRAAPPGEPPEQDPVPRRELSPALRSLLEQVSELESDNDRLRADNARLAAEIERLRSLVRRAGGKIIQQATELVDGTPEPSRVTSGPGAGEH